jgi:hypothetical protein
MTASTSLLDAVADAVAGASRSGKRLVDRVKYLPETDQILIVCLPLAFLISRKSVTELSNLNQNQIENINLSASGATIKIPEADVYIEAASLIASHLYELKMTGKGGLIIDLMK